MTEIAKPEPLFVYGPDRSDKIAMPIVYGCLFVVMWGLVVLRIIEKRPDGLGLAEYGLILFFIGLSAVLFRIGKNTYTQRIEVFADEFEVFNRGRRQKFSAADYKYFCCVREDRYTRFLLVNGDYSQGFFIPFAQYGRKQKEMHEWISRHFAPLKNGWGTLDSPVNNAEVTKELQARQSRGPAS